MRTADNFPFQTPLLGYILRGYFIEGRPKRDSLLIARLHREQHIPVALIIMATVLVRFISKVENFCTYLFLDWTCFTRVCVRVSDDPCTYNSHPCQPVSSQKLTFSFSYSHVMTSYWSVTETMSNLQQQAAPYVERLQTDLYQAMMWVFFLWIYRSIPLHSLPSF